MSGYTVSSFSDVATHDWYFSAVQWAYKNDIANGNAGSFAPADSATRVEAAKMIALLLQDVVTR